MVHVAALRTALHGPPLDCRGYGPQLIRRANVELEHSNRSRCSYDLCRPATLPCNTANVQNVHVQCSVQIAVCPSASRRQCLFNSFITRITISSICTNIAMLGATDPKSSNFRLLRRLFILLAGHTKSGRVFQWHSPKSFKQRVDTTNKVHEKKRLWNYIDSLFRNLHNGHNDDDNNNSDDDTDDNAHLKLRRFKKMKEYEGAQTHLHIFPPGT